MADVQRGLTNGGRVERLVSWFRRKSGVPGDDASKSEHKKRKATREDFVKYACEMAAAMEAEGIPERMHRCSYKLIRLELYERAWELRVRAAEIEQPSPLPEWDGSDLSGRTILVRAYTPRNRVGEEVRLARFIAPVTKQARRTIVLAEPRLVPLLARSFDGVEVRPRGVNDAAAFAEADVTAYYETVALHHARTAEEMRRSFVRLKADPARSAQLRGRYRQGSSGPVIGIAWGGSNGDKVVPDLPGWASVLSWPSATFVSLQHGDTAADLAVLRKLASGPVIEETEINQMVDLDGFAAQIAALDGVIAISNTTIDVAGMVGVPTGHIRDDNLSSAIWPRSGPSSWYPDMIFVYRKRRPWCEVLAEARTRLEKVIA
jgi:hypothetical protein